MCDALHESSHDVILNGDILLTICARKARVLSRAQSHDVNTTAVRRRASPLTPAPRLTGQLSESDVRPSRDAFLDQVFHRQSTGGLANDRETRNGRPAVEQNTSSARVEKPVLADLGGSESAVDITKKVCRYSESVFGSSS